MGEEIRAGQACPLASPPPAPKTFGVGGEGRVRGVPRSLATASLRGPHYRGANALVRAAATEVAGHRPVDIRVRRFGVSCEQGCRRHDLSRLTITALRNFLRDPRALQFVAAVGGKTFDSGDLLVLKVGQWRGAGTCRFAVDE